MLFNIFIWLAPIFYSLSYILLSSGYLHKGNIYLIMNIIGSVSSIAGAYHTDVMQTVIASTIWLIITVLALIKKEFKLNFLKKWMFYVSVASTILVSYFIIDELIEYRFLQALGFSTVVIFTLIYFLFLNGKMAEHEFHLWNVLASIIMVIITYNADSMPVLASYLIWGIAGLYGFIKTFRSLSITAHEKV